VKKRGLFHYGKFQKEIPERPINIIIIYCNGNRI
jgi:hypothetical protein